MDRAVRPFRTLVVDLVLGRRNRLRLGYFIVRNRGQQDKSTSTEDRHRQEAEFFNSSPWSSDKSRVGIFALKARLVELLNEITRREYPRVDQEIARQLTESLQLWLISRQQICH